MVDWARISTAVMPEEFEMMEWARFKLDSISTPAVGRIWRVISRPISFCHERVRLLVHRTAPKVRLARNAMMAMTRINDVEDMLERGNDGRGCGKGS